MKIITSSSHTVFKTNTHQPIGVVGRVFVDGQGDRGSIPGRVIPKTQKWYLIPPFLTLLTIKHVSRVKWNNPDKEVALSPIPWCSSCCKGSILVALDYGCQFTFIYIYICVCVSVCVFLYTTGIHSQSSHTKT